jgi:hypothetical protein
LHIYVFFGIFQEGGLFFLYFDTYNFKNRKKNVFKSNSQMSFIPKEHSLDT